MERYTDLGYGKEGPAIEFYAAYDIVEGTELTYSYGPHFDVLPRHMRTKFLPFGSPCWCSACTRTIAGELATPSQAEAM